MSEPALILAWERLTAELMGDTRRFGASFRHNLGQYVNTALLDGLCLVAELPYRSPVDKQEGLQALDSLVGRLRVLIRQCYTQQALGERRYTLHQSRINDIGKMIGGWLKYLGDQEERADR